MAGQLISGITNPDFYILCDYFSGLEAWKSIDQSLLWHEPQKFKAEIGFASQPAIIFSGLKVEFSDRVVEIKSLAAIKS